MKKIFVALLVLLMSITTIAIGCASDTIPTTVVPSNPNDPGSVCDGATCYDNIIGQSDTQTASGNVLGSTPSDPWTPTFTQAGFVFAGSSGDNNYFHQNLEQHADSNTVYGIMNQVGGIASVITSSKNDNYQNLIQNANSNTVAQTGSMTQLGIETALIQKDKTYLNQYANQAANSNQVLDGKFVQSDIKAAMVVIDPTNVHNIGLLFDPTKIRPGVGERAMDP